MRGKHKRHEPKDYSGFQIIRITGVQAPDVLRRHFSSRMVDVAYVTKIEGNTVEARTDVGTNLADPTDRDWMLD